MQIARHTEQQRTGRFALAQNLVYSALNTVVCLPDTLRVSVAVTVSSWNGSEGSSVEVLMITSPAAGALLPE